VGIVLSRLLEAPAAREGGPRVLVIAPTRELANQIADELRWLFASLGARVGVVTGGTNIGGDFRMLQGGPTVLIGTPGRLVDHLQRGSLRLSALEAVVLDEADEMLDMGFRDELEAILDQAPAERRTLMVSATFAREVARLANRYQRDALMIEGTKLGEANEDIQQLGMLVSAQHRLAALINILLASPGERVLVFSRTRVGTSTLAAELLANGFSASALSGEMGQRERTATLDAFRAGKVQILVATDVAARGLDIRNVSKVVHFDIPENADVFTHRSGRTGRAGEKGTSIMLVPPQAQRRVERMFAAAGVSICWERAPSAAAIVEAADQRLVEEMAEVEAFDGQTRLHELATRLLQEADAETIIAALLARTDHVGPCAPREVPVVELRSSKRKGQKHGGPRDRQATEYRDFYVGWGRRNGATPARLLAMVCRRGDVRSNVIGAIHVGEFQSVVQVDCAVSENFEKGARRPDERNPKIKIRPWVGKGGKGFEWKPERKQGFRPSGKGGKFARKGAKPGKGGFKPGRGYGRTE
jgi:ATP-dependent RNA helicase DeaD